MRIQYYIQGEKIMVNIKITNESKPFWKSRTFQMATLTVILGVLKMVQGDLDAGIPLTLMSVLMMFMRSITETAVKFNKQ